MTKKSFLGKTLLTVLCAGALSISANAQQWSGDTTTTAPITRTGNVGIGLGAGIVPTSKLTVNGGGKYSIDLRVNGRMQSGDANNVGGLWVNESRTQFFGQVDANRIGLFNGGWKVVLDKTGKLGIGTSTPATNLHVNQNNIAGGFRIGWGSQFPSLVTDISYPKAGGLVINAKANGTWARVTFQCDGVSRMTISKSNVAVDGLLVAEEIEVKDVAADYVFEDNYKLRSLEEVENYIKQNKHLPGVAPASETEKGIKVGEFNEKLLEKIEELTLYVIDLKKQNDALKSKVSSLETSINK